MNGGLEINNLGNTIALGAIATIFLWLLMKSFGFHFKFKKEIFENYSFIFNVVIIGLVFTFGLVIEDIAKNIAAQRPEPKGDPNTSFWDFPFRIIEWQIPFDGQFRIEPIINKNSSIISIDYLQVEDNSLMFKQLNDRGLIKKYLWLNGLDTNSYLNNKKCFSADSFFVKEIKGKKIALRKNPSDYYSFFGMYLKKQGTCECFENKDTMRKRSNTQKIFNNALEELYYTAKNNVYTEQTYFSELSNYNIKINFMRGLILLSTFFIIITFFITILYFILYPINAYLSDKQNLTFSSFYNYFKKIENEFKLIRKRKRSFTVVLFSLLLYFSFLLIILNASRISYCSSHINHNNRVFGYYLDFDNIHSKK